MTGGTTGRSQRVRLTIKSRIDQGPLQQPGGRGGLGPGALAIVPAVRELARDKFILAAFIFDFLSELHRAIKRYPNGGD